jgi:serine/threonine protein kinase
MYSESDIRDMLVKVVDLNKVPKKLRIIYNTTEFFHLDYDDILILQDRPYFIRNCCKEGRFGIGEQDKYWVRRAIDLSSGQLKIIKMVYHENFNIKIGNVSIDFVRSPRKEGRVLNKVKGHQNFMQGITLIDDAGNIIRVADFIVGKSWHEIIPGLGKDHKDYYYNYFPQVLSEFIELITAMGFLHSHGELHGDIRVDHILKEATSGINKWIDFDYSYMMHGESHFGFDLFGILDVLVYLVGRGHVTLHNLSQLLRGADLKTLDLYQDDLNVFVKGRIVNLRKVYPYISERLNSILLHVSIGHDDFYDSTGQIVHDLKEVLIDLQR